MPFKCLLSEVLEISEAGNSAEKPCIFLEGGIHSREWIATSTVLYIAGTRWQGRVSAVCGVCIGFQDLTMVQNYHEVMNRESCGSKKDRASSLLELLKPIERCIVARRR